MNLDFYKVFNPELSNLSDIEVLHNFFKNGINEDIIFDYSSFLKKYPEFDIDFYRYFNEDLKFLQNIKLCYHYHNIGKTEHRIYNMDTFNSINTEFDIDAYIKYNSDVYNKSTKEIIIHYATIGKSQNRICNYSKFILLKFPDFDVNYYLKFNDDLINLRKIDYYKHFHLHGRNENRIYSNNSFHKLYPDFDINFYKNFNSYISELDDLDIKLHFHKSTNKENVIYNNNSFSKLYPDFDFKMYKSFNCDISDFSEIELKIHYYVYGIKENRIYNNESFYKFYPDFDINFYKKFNPDISKLDEMELKIHFHNYINKENRIYNNESFYRFYPDFDINLYKKFNPDISHLDDMKLKIHFHLNGIKEHRIYNNESFYKFYPEFDINLYKTFNSDLANLDEINIKIHFHFYGRKENRIYNNKNTLYSSLIDLGVDLKFYKKFNKELVFNTDQEYLTYFNNVSNIKNKEYFEFDFDTVNLNKDILDINLKNKISNHSLIRNITNYDELYKYNIQYQKPFYIYNKKSFYEYYPDFDLEFYKNKYFSNSKENIQDIDVMAYYHLDGKYKKHLINNKKKIIIYTPPFDIKCGGIVVMHYLAKIINEYNPSRFYCKLFMHNNIKYNNIFCTDFARMDEINDNTIVIYPEIISGNPLGCKNVIRWILLELGIEMPLDHSKNWSSTDLIYYWEPKNIYLNKMTCHYLNPIFKNTNNNIRYKTCYLIKKGQLIHFNINYFHPSDSINIDNFSLEEMTNIFNQCKYFYSYDPKSMYIIYALICGCTPIIYPLENISKEDYFKTTIFYKNNTIYTKGISYGNSEEEVNYAVNTMNEGLNDLNLIFNTERNTVYDFLENIYLI
jgi:hypothetical protein